MKTKSWERAALPAALVLAALLAACGDRVENTEMPQAPQASVEINRQGEEGAKDPGQAIGVAHDTSTMGASAAPAAAPDDPDNRIATQVQTTLAADPDFTAMKIDVHSDDGVVTLRGRAPDPQSRDRATDIARTVRDVKSVDNQLTLG